MSRWAALPAELDPRVRQLVVRLRRLKDHSGLSLRQLAARTGYSQKSWERYLGGRSLPSREAVVALARAVGEDPTRLLALHEIAEEAWGEGRPDAAKATTPGTTTVIGAAPRSPGRSLRVALVAGSVALVLAVSTAVLLVVRLGGEEEKQPAASLSATTASASASASRSGPAYTCRPERIDGRWYAGISRGSDAILAAGHAGPEVAEAQCLLRRAGISPGDVDGIFGPLTERAVKQAQQQAGLVVDGIIGPHTWKVLRR